MIKKIFCAVFIAALSAGIFACGGDTATDNSRDLNTGSISQPPGDTAAPNEDNSEPPEKQLPDLPESDFEGYGFRIFSHGPAYAEWQSFDINAEEENGDPINDSVYRRNRFVEEKLNVNIIEVPSAAWDMEVRVRRSVAAGDDSYDAVATQMEAQANLAVGGNLLDLKPVPHLDLSKKWWDQRANIDLTIGNKLFFTVGDLFIMDNDATWLIIFNKELMRDLALENSYDLVRSGQWTFDKLLDMSKGVSRDINGDGIMDRHDFYGIVCQGENMTAYYLASGEKFVQKDASDLPFAAMDGERALSVVEKIYDLMYDNTVSFNYWDLPDQEAFKITQGMFENNQAVFKVTALQLVIRMRHMETNFGIIPMPKFDAAQQSYYHYVHPIASALSVPMTNTDITRTGIILEALAAESYYTVRPAYYDISIEGKFLRDEESIEMLDIILATRVFDLAKAFIWNGLGSILDDMYRPKHRDFVSRYERLTERFSNAINRTIELFETLD
jgi:ABC-type glycerol-3-phosphate transport system substrate-binding protein